MDTPFSRALSRATLAVLVLGALIPAAQAQVSTPIGALPAVITKPGYYVLKVDRALTKMPAANTPTAAILITADNVVIDLGGRTLSTALPDTVESYGIRSEVHANLTIKNGSIRGFGTGVRLNSFSAESTGLTVENVHVDKARNYGIELLGADLAVRRCKVTNTDSSNSSLGISVDGGTAVIEENEVLATGNANSTSYAISTSVQTGIISHNRVINDFSTKGTVGIRLAFSTAYVAEANTIANFISGLVFTSAAPGKYRDNITVGCTTPYTLGVDAGNNK